MKPPASVTGVGLARAISATRRLSDADRVIQVFTEVISSRLKRPLINSAERKSTLGGTLERFAKRFDRFSIEGEA